MRARYSIAQGRALCADCRGCLWRFHTFRRRIFRSSLCSHEASRTLPIFFSGELNISGILTVLRKPNPMLPEDMKMKLQQLSDTLSENGGLLTVVENKVTSLRTGNGEYIEVLKMAAGTRGLELTEFAIGVNDEIAPLIDYKMNSQLNEGVGGVHLAIGDGSSGYHIDFLSPAANVSPITQ